MLYNGRIFVFKEKSCFISKTVYEFPNLVLIIFIPLFHNFVPNLIYLRNIFKFIKTYFENGVLSLLKLTVEKQTKPFETYKRRQIQKHTELTESLKKCRTSVKLTYFFCMGLNGTHVYKREETKLS